MNFFLKNSNEKVDGHGAPDSPVARLAGISQGVVLNALAKSHGVQLNRYHFKGHFNVSQTLSPSRLCKNQDSKPHRAILALDAIIAGVERNDSGKTCPWNELYYLSKSGLAGITRKPLRSLNLENYPIMEKRISNRF